MFKSGISVVLGAGARPINDEPNVFLDGRFSRDDTAIFTENIKHMTLI